jgi:hypothetical protein
MRPKEKFKAIGEKLYEKCLVMNPETTDTEEQ